MLAVSAVKTVAGRGLAGDVSLGRQVRQVLLIEKETLDQYGLAPGQVRENIVVEGIRLAGLAPGVRVQLGQVMAEVTGDCAPCEDLIGAIRPGLVEEITGRRGTFVRVLEDGEVRVGDQVSSIP